MYELYPLRLSAIDLAWFRKLESVGGRRNPWRPVLNFTKVRTSMRLWHAVQVSASGRVIIAGWQRGYGKVVYVDHGNGLNLLWSSFCD